MTQLSLRSCSICHSHHVILVTDAAAESSLTICPACRWKLISAQGLSTPRKSEFADGEKGLPGLTAQPKAVVRHYASRQR